MTTRQTRKLEYLDLLYGVGLAFHRIHGDGLKTGTRRQVEIFAEEDFGTELESSEALEERPHRLWEIGTEVSELRQPGLQTRPFLQRGAEKGGKRRGRSGKFGHALKASEVQSLEGHSAEVRHLGGCVDAAVGLGEVHCVGAKLSEGLQEGGGKGRAALLVHFQALERGGAFGVRGQRAFGGQIPELTVGVFQQGLGKVQRHEQHREAGEGLRTKAASQRVLLVHVELCQRVSKEAKHHITYLPVWGRRKECRPAQMRSLHT